MPEHHIAQCSRFRFSYDNVLVWVLLWSLVLHFLELSPLRENWYFKVCHLHRCQNSLGVLLDVYGSIWDYSPASFGWRDGQWYTPTGTRTHTQKHLMIFLKWTKQLSKARSIKDLQLKLRSLQGGVVKTKDNQKKSKGKWVKKGSAYLFFCLRHLCRGYLLVFFVEHLCCCKERLDQTSHHQSLVKSDVADRINLPCQMFVGNT